MLDDGFSFISFIYFVNRLNIDFIIIALSMQNKQQGGHYQQYMANHVSNAMTQAILCVWLFVQKLGYCKNLPYNSYSYLQNTQTTLTRVYISVLIFVEGGRKHIFYWASTFKRHQPSESINRPLQYQIATSMRKEDEQQRDTEVTSIFGIYFCQRCRNIITPSRANGNFLEFICQTCGPQQIDFNQRFHDDCLLYTKEQQATYSKKYVIDESHVFDPSLSIVEVTCPECGHDRAIYTMAPDENETKLVARMMCASVTGTVAKCSFIWELDDDDLLMEDCVMKGKKAQQQEEDVM